MLSPLTLLKQSYVSFTTQLNKYFYDELLYILGLEEKQQSKGIERLPKSRRQNGTLVELIYTALLLNNINFKNETEEFDYVINVVINYTNRIGRL
ncbi:type IIG restriction enzyme/methyltransferase [Ligilactobacillus salivarius]